MYLTGVGVGETTLFAVDDNDNVLMSARIRVTHNIEALQQGIASVAPGQSGHRRDGRPVAGADRHGRDRRAGGQRAAGGEPVRRRPDARGEPHDAWRRRPRSTSQVRIAEVVAQRRPPARHPLERVSGNAGGARIGFIGGGGAAGGARRGYSASDGATRGSFNIDVVLQALAEEGLVTIMAEPNLTARSGEPATFLAGGEYPYADGQRGRHQHRVQGLRHRAELHADGDGRQPDQPDGRAPRSASSTSPTTRTCRRSAPAGPRPRSISPAARASPSPG